MDKSCFQRAIERTRPVLHGTLARLYAPYKFRPVIRPDLGEFSRLGLLVDATTIPTFRPVARFEEAKAYWDGKNKIYGMLHHTIHLIFD